MDTMSPLDATFLHVEDGVTHMHIGACAILEGPPPPYEDLVSLVESKLPLIPRYRQRVRFVPAALGRPVWVDDPHFNLAYHIRHSALPPPGGREELCALMGRVMSQPLDRNRPLWEAWMVEGLADRRWALVLKVHHCMVDGVAGVDLAAVLFDTDRNPHRGSFDRWTPRAEPSGLRLVAAAAHRALGDPGTLVRAARHGPRRLLREVAAVARGAVSLGRRLGPTTSLSIEGAIGPHRRWTWAEADLDDVALIRKAFGGTVNDAVLTAVTGGFRQLLLARNEAVDSAVVRALVPVSVRPPGDRSGGNLVSAMVAELPVAVEDPRERLAAVQAQMAQLKADHQVDAGEALFGLAETMPPAMWAVGLRSAVTAVRHFPQRRVHTVVTNVPGPRRPLFAAGRHLEAYLPFVPIAHGARIGVAVVSYRSHLAFGLTGDWETTADLDVMRAGIEDTVADLVRAAFDADGDGAPPHPPAPAEVN